MNACQERDSTERWRRSRALGRAFLQVRLRNYGNLFFFFAALCSLNLKFLHLSRITTHAQAAPPESSAALCGMLIPPNCVDGKVWD